MTRGRAWLWGIACAASALLVLGFFLDRQQAAYSYLFAFGYVWTLVMGALFLLMIGNATNAMWFVPLRRQCERTVGTLPLLALLLVPILVFVDDLYPWTHWRDLPDLEREHVAKKLAWLNGTFFVVRSLIYMLLFILFAELLRHWSARQDQTSDEQRAAALRRRMVNLSVGGLVALSVVLTLAGWDWLMTIEPAWYSNLYGVYLFGGGILAALGLLGTVTVAARRRGTLPEQISSSHYHAIGRLQLAFLIFWAYIGWAHVLQQWIANLPLEALWYVPRWHNGWQWEGLALVFAHFVLPFLLLLLRPIKKNPTTFSLVSSWLVLVHALDLHYLVLPALHAHRYELHWLDFTALVALSSLTACFAGLRGSRWPALPENDPLLAQGLAYESQS